jgi:hypothetical protein
MKTAATPRGIDMFGSRNEGEARIQQLQPERLWKPSGLCRAQDDSGFSRVYRNERPQQSDVGVSPAFAGYVLYPRLFPVGLTMS